jgi:septal ring factor EnvC (AmiA/AmiB activator)
MDRKLALRTYVGAALAGLALAAGIAAIMLSLGANEDTATDADVQDLREELTGVEQTAAQAAEQDARKIRKSLTELEGQLGDVSDEQGSTQDELSVVKDDIQDLRTEISDLRSADTGPGGAGTSGQTGE